MAPIHFDFDLLVFTVLYSCVFVDFHSSYYFLSFQTSVTYYFSIFFSDNKKKTLIGRSDSTNELQR